MKRTLDRACRFKWLVVLGWVTASVACSPEAEDASFLSSQGTLQDGTGLTGDYYDTENFTTKRLTRIDPGVNFDWRNGSPDPSIAPETFSVSWTGFVVPRFSGLYTFSVISDDGSRLVVNGQTLINRMTYHAATEYSGTLQLTAGQAYPIKLDYFEGTGGALVRMLWSSADQAREIIPAAALYSTNPFAGGQDAGTPPTQDAGTPPKSDAGTPPAQDAGTPVTQPPVITSFSANPTSILAGGSSTLSWNVSGATSVSVDQNIGTVSSSGTRAVSPGSTTTYTLSATNSAGVTRATATVAVTTGGGTGTNLSGTLTTQTLTLAGSPYNVTGNLTVPAGSRLTIEPGVKLIFTGRYKLSVRGRITAQGTSSSPITFTASNPSTGWTGLRLAGTSDPGSDFVEWCIFEYGNKNGGLDGAGPDGAYSEVGGGAVYLNARASVNFNNNELRFNKAPGFGGAMMLIAANGPGTAVGNSFHDNQVTGPLTQYQGRGGAIYIDHLSATNRWIFREGAFRNNSAPEGGGLFVGESSVTLDSIAMSGNSPQNWVTDDPPRLTIVNTPRP